MPDVIFPQTTTWAGTWASHAAKVNLVAQDGAGRRKLTQEIFADGVLSHLPLQGDLGASLVRWQGQAIGRHAASVKTVRVETQVTESVVIFAAVGDLIVDGRWLRWGRSRRVPLGHASQVQCPKGSFGMVFELRTAGACRSKAPRLLPVKYGFAHPNKPMVDADTLWQQGLDGRGRRRSDPISAPGAAVVRSHAGVVMSASGPLTPGRQLSVRAADVPQLLRRGSPGACVTVHWPALWDHAPSVFKKSSGVFVVIPALVSIGVEADWHAPWGELELEDRFLGRLHIPCQRAGSRVQVNAATMARQMKIVVDEEPGRPVPLGGLKRLLHKAWPLSRTASEAWFPEPLAHELDDDEESPPGHHAVDGDAIELSVALRRALCRLAEARDMDVDRLAEAARDLLDDGVTLDELERVLSGAAPA